MPLKAPIMQHGRYMPSSGRPAWWGGGEPRWVHDAPRSASAVVPLPLSVVESNLWDVTTWAAFLGGVEAIHRTSPERYLVEVREGRRVVGVPVAVRWHPRGRFFAWRESAGPRWRGELRLDPLNGRRTRLHLTLDTRPRTQAARLAHWVAPRPLPVAADVERLCDRFVGIPRPFNPRRLGAGAGAGPRGLPWSDDESRRVPQPRRAPAEAHTAVHRADADA